MWRGLTAIILLCVVIALTASEYLQLSPTSTVMENNSERQVSPPEPTIPARPVIDMPPPGEPLLVELIEAPLSQYSSAEMTDADVAYEAVIRELQRADVRYDSNLGHAARELAYQHSVLGGLVPRPVVDFLLRAGGAVDRTVLQAYTATSGDDLTEIRNRVEKILGSDRSRIRRVGVGEAYVPGLRNSRYIAILVSERSIEVNPAPRTTLPNTRWLLSGTLPEGWSSPTSLVLYPNGRLESLQVRAEGRRFALSVPAGSEEGRMDVSLSAVGPYGPSPLIQVPVVIGRSLPTVLETWVPPDESSVESTAQAEALAFRLLNEDRLRFGLEPLVRDSGLDGVARSHSVDMRDYEYFGHWSDNSGSPGDRLAEASIKAVSFAENVAFGGTIHGAEEGLMHSLGHRRNILNPQFSHVGIGVAGKSEGGALRWYLTQLFTVPATDIDAEASEVEVLTRIDTMRRREGRRALARDTRLDALAERAALVAAAGGTDELAGQLLRDAKEAGHTRRGGFAWIRVVADPSSMSLPKDSVSAAYAHVGLAVVQLPDHPSGLVGVALLMVGEP